MENGCFLRGEHRFSNAFGLMSLFTLALQSKVEKCSRIFVGIFAQSSLSLLQFVVVAWRKCIPTQCLKKQQKCLILICNPKYGFKVQLHLKLKLK